MSVFYIQRFKDSVIVIDEIEQIWSSWNITEFTDSGLRKFIDRLRAKKRDVEIINQL